MIDSDQLTSLLTKIELAPFRIESTAAREALQSLVDVGGWGFLMPDAAHSGLAVRCRVVQVGPAHLLLQTESDIATGWPSAMAAVPHGRHVLRFQIRGLRVADADQGPEVLGRAVGAETESGAGAGDTLLHGAYPPAVWQVPRRAVFRVAPPTQPPLCLRANGQAGGEPWQGDVIDLGIGGLAARVAGDRPPCAVGDILPACRLSDGRYTSPHLDLRVCSVTATDPAGHWRIGCALLDPSREVVSSLQLATYRFETEQRRQRLAQTGPAGDAGDGGVNPLRRQVDRR